MAQELGCNSIRYLPIESIANAVNLPADQLCQACITSNYPTVAGQQLYQIALESVKNNKEASGRIFEDEPATVDAV